MPDLTGTTALWTVIIGLALGSYLLRFTFIGFVGDRALPPWLMRHLRYTAVAIIPALIAPLVAWPAATGGQPDLPRLLAVLVTLGVGYASRNVIAGILAGAVVFYGLVFWMG